MRPVRRLAAIGWAIVVLTLVGSTLLPAVASAYYLATWIEFAVPVRIENTGAVPLEFTACASRLEAQTGSSWNAVWAPICSANASTLPAIPPGERRDVTMNVSAALDGPGSPEWRSDNVAGTYRFVAGLILSGVGGRIPTVASNTFTLAPGN